MFLITKSRQLVSTKPNGGKVEKRGENVRAVTPGVESRGNRLYTADVLYEYAL